MPLLTPKRRRDVSAYSVAIDFSAGVVGAILFGLIIDWIFGSLPIGLVTCAILGVIGATYRFMKDALRMSRRFEQEQASKQDVDDSA